MSFVKLGAGPPPNFSDPIGMLLQCHRKMEDQLAALERGAAALGDQPTEALAAIQGAVTWFETAGARHTEDEEASFFSRLYGSAELLGDLQAEHRAHEAILLSLKTILAQYEPSLAAELRTHAAALVAATREHIADEEARFIPLARQMDETELRAAGIEMRLRRGGDKP